MREGGREEERERERDREEMLIVYSLQVVAFFHTFLESLEFISVNVYGELLNRLFKLLNL